MKKVYKGWELLKEIAEGNIKKNTKFNVYRNGELYFTDYVIYNKQNLKINNGLQLIDFLTLQNMLSLDFELIEDQEEINIQDIEEIEELDRNLKFDDLITPYGKNEDMMWTEIIKQHNKIDEIIRYIKRKDKSND